MHPEAQPLAAGLHEGRAGHGKRVDLALHGGIRRPLSDGEVVEAPAADVALEQAAQLLHPRLGDSEVAAQRRRLPQHRGVLGNHTRGQQVLVHARLAPVLRMERPAHLPPPKQADLGRQVLLRHSQRVALSDHQVAGDNLDGCVDAFVGAARPHQPDLHLGVKEHARTFLTSREFSSRIRPAARKARIRAPSTVSTPWLLRPLARAGVLLHPVERPPVVRDDEGDVPLRVPGARHCGERQGAGAGARFIRPAASGRAAGPPPLLQFRPPAGRFLCAPLPASPRAPASGSTGSARRARW